MGCDVMEGWRDGLADGWMGGWIDGQNVDQSMANECQSISRTILALRSNTTVNNLINSLQAKWLATMIEMFSSVESIAR